jgi:hypothetical protein
MSDTIKQKRPFGFEFWTARPSKGLRQPGRLTKRITHRLERRYAVRSIRQELEAV